MHEVWGVSVSCHQPSSDIPLQSRGRKQGLPHVEVFSACVPMSAPHVCPPWERTETCLYKSWLGHRGQKRTVEIIALGLLCQPNRLSLCDSRFIPVEWVSRESGRRPSGDLEVGPGAARGKAGLSLQPQGSPHVSPHARTSLCGRRASSFRS